MYIVCISYAQTELEIVSKHKPDSIILGIEKKINILFFKMTVRYWFSSISNKQFVYIYIYISSLVLLIFIPP